MRGRILPRTKWSPNGRILGKTLAPLTVRGIRRLYGGDARLLPQGRWPACGCTSDRAVPSGVCRYHPVPVDVPALCSNDSEGKKSPWAGTGLLGSHGGGLRNL